MVSESEELHLQAAVHRLRLEFKGEFAEEMISAEIENAASRWSDAPVRQFVPVLAERTVRDHLRQRHIARGA